MFEVDWEIVTKCGGQVDEGCDCDVGEF